MEPINAYFEEKKRIKEEEEELKRKIMKKNIDCCYGGIVFMCVLIELTSPNENFGLSH